MFDAYCYSPERLDVEYDKTSNDDCDDGWSDWGWGGGGGGGDGGGGGCINDDNEYDDDDDDLGELTIAIDNVPAIRVTWKRKPNRITSLYLFTAMQTSEMVVL